MYSINQPKITVKQYVINDVCNPIKQHVFRIYKDYHITYNQAINGFLRNKGFRRANKQHGYYEYLTKVKN